MTAEGTVQRVGPLESLIRRVVSLPGQSSQESLNVLTIRDGGIIMKLRKLRLEGYRCIEDSGIVHMAWI